ncbi:hypothetical protein, partial [Thiolapillus sp.]|uniref:hypothetical protein n=1 Tax=Thiolapillus sp. TaxID=2017437 RepID=UPI003AF5A1E9
CVDATGVVCHQLGLLSTDLHAVGHHTSEEGQPAAVPEPSTVQPHQPPKQSHAENNTEQIETASGEDHC